MIQYTKWNIGKRSLQCTSIFSRQIFTQSLLNANDQNINKNQDSCACAYCTGTFSAHIIKFISLTVHLLNWKEACFVQKLKSDRKWMLLLNNCHKIISGHFFAIFIFIFHKTDVRTVILRCLAGLIYDWLKSYDTKHKYFHFFFFAILYKNRYLHLFCFLRFCVFCHNLCTN